MKLQLRRTDSITLGCVGDKIHTILSPMGVIRRNKRLWKFYHRWDLLSPYRMYLIKIKMQMKLDATFWVLKRVIFTIIKNEVLDDAVLNRINYNLHQL